MPPLRGREIRPHPGRAGHGLIVARSHASQISSPRSARHTGIELDVASVISSPDQVTADKARQLSAALSRSDVLLRTSRGHAGIGVEGVTAGRRGAR